MRKLHLDNGEVVEYYIGACNVKFRFQSGKSLVARLWTVKGVTPDVFCRGQHKNTRDGRVTPSELKRFLMNNG